MHIKVIASGSKGNATLLISEQSKILIDVGISYRKLLDSLLHANVSPKQLDGILVTHAHTDHIKGLASLIKQTNKKVLIPVEMFEEINKYIDKDHIEVIDRLYTLNDITIEMIPTSHDTACSVGYIIESNTKSLVYVTDTGYINERILKKLHNKDMYIIESNHDVEMLMNGPYPYYLKQRVVGDRGHLSNETTSNYLKDLIGDKTKHIILAHLSENNNTEDAALTTLYEICGQELLSNRTILVAKQNEESELLEI